MSGVKHCEEKYRQEKKDEGVGNAVVLEMMVREVKYGDI